MLYKGDTLYLDWLEDGIAELVFDAPGSVNKLDTATVASLGHALDVLEKQPNLKGLLLRSNKAAFIVGADITEFLSLFLVPEEQLSQWLHFANSVFNRLEDLPVPTLSAVNGYALGGGCECVHGNRLSSGNAGPAHWSAGNQAGHYAGLWRLCAYATYAGCGQRAGNYCGR